MSAEEIMELSGSSQIFDAAFHPTTDLLATALISGGIEVWKLPTAGDEDEGSATDDESDVVLSLNYHTGACRAVRYFGDGRLLSISADQSWALVGEDGRVAHHAQRAHSSSLNKLELIDEFTFATGDDSGVVKLWDARSPKSAVLSWDAHTDFVSALQFAPNNRQLFSVAGDATLCVYDIRNAKNFYKSDDQESELTALTVLEDRKLVVCGTDEGTLLVFKWGLWGDCSDRFPTQMDSINTLACLRDGRTLLAGSGSGDVCALSLYPMRQLGKISALEEEGTVEGMALRAPVPGAQPAAVYGSNIGSDYSQRSLLATFAFSERIVLWDVTDVEEALANITLQQQLEESSSSGGDDSDGDEVSDDEDQSSEGSDGAEVAKEVAGEESSVGVDESASDDETAEDDDGEDDDDEDDDEDEDDEDDDDDDDEENDDDDDDDDDDDGDGDEGEDGGSGSGSKIEEPVKEAAHSNPDRKRKRDQPSDGAVAAAEANGANKTQTSASKAAAKPSKPDKRLKTDSERFYADL